MPKNRDTVYTVVRYSADYEGLPKHKTLIDTFRTFEAAQDQADSYEQEMKDRGIPEVKYNVESSTYYHE